MEWLQVQHLQNRKIPLSYRNGNSALQYRWHQVLSSEVQPLHYRYESNGNSISILPHCDRTSISTEILKIWKINFLMLYKLLRLYTFYKFKINDQLYFHCQNGCKERNADLQQHHNLEWLGQHQGSHNQLGSVVMPALADPTNCLTDEPWGKRKKKSNKIKNVNQYWLTDLHLCKC